jgi:hypothetical protein
MQRRQKDIFAGILLILSFAFYWPHLTLIVPNLKRLIQYRGISYMFESAQQFTWVTADFLFVFVPIMAVIAGLLALLGKRKGALILAGISFATMFFASCLTLLSYYFGEIFFSLGIVTSFEQAFLGHYSEYFRVSNAGNQWFSYAPVSILLIISSVLLYARGQSKVALRTPFSFQLPASTQVPTTQVPASQVPYGAKKCPECAELIQVDAIKCRFCNYRYR